MMVRKSEKILATSLKQKIPVAFFAYDRPAHTARALDALAACCHRDSFDFYCFSDAPRDESSVQRVEQVREILKERATKFPAEIITASVNQGVAKSICNGVTSLCESHGRVVVVEDDLLVGPDFLRFMARALERYEASPNVMQIGALTIAPPEKVDADAFFLPVTTTWGWATWARAWREFSFTPRGWPGTARDASWLSLFNINGAGNYVTMLEDCLNGRNDSWGILWWYAVSRCRGEVLYPRRSLVWNSGFDGSGVHCGNGRGPAWQREQVTTRIFRESIAFPNETHHRSEDFDLLERTLRGRSVVPAGLGLRLRRLFRR